MDLYELYLGCRRGDLDKVRFLVEEKEVDVNVRDKWDSTPLSVAKYYACLCGHERVVQFLLENGARCEANSFDGERCLYGALSPEIRQLLRQHHAVSSRIVRRDQFQEFLRRLLESGHHSDVCFEVHGQRFYAHRCILCARSDYFNDRFLEQWGDRALIHISHQLVTPLAFASILQFLYLGCLQLSLDAIDDVKRLAKHCKLHELHARITDMQRKAHFFQSTKPGTHVTSLLVEPPPHSAELQSDFEMLAEETLPPQFCHWIGGSELPFYCQQRAPFADVVFEVEGHRFLCHKAFVCGRSEYLATLLRDPLCEQQQGTLSAAPAVKLRSVTAAVFIDVLFYIYTNAAQLKQDSVLAVLLAADMLLLPGLKRLCGAFLASCLDVDNVLSLLRTARLFQLHRLEDACYEFVAARLEQLIDDDELLALVAEDAAAVRLRQETDSIDIVDNIRYHLSATSIADAEERLRLVDGLLERLNLDA